MTQGSLNTIPKQEKQKQKQVLPPELANMTPITSSDDEGEFIKLTVGGYIKGILVDKYNSTKYKGRSIYKIKEKDEPHVKILLGTTILDKWMSSVDIGTEVAIIRREDKPSDKGNPLQDYEVMVE